MYIITKKYKMDRKIFNDFLGHFIPKNTIFLTKLAKMGKRVEYIKKLYRSFFFADFDLKFFIIHVNFL